MYQIKSDLDKKLYDQIGFLFDLDGVLIDSEREYTKIWEEIDKRFCSGVPSLPIVIKGMTLIEIIDQYFPQPEKRKEVPALLYELEEKMKYEWLPGAKELLESLRENNMGVALVTSSNQRKMQHLRKELPDAESFFKKIITGDRVKKSKPDPEGYLLGARLIGKDPSKCVVFEDSLQGVKAGKAAGAFVVGVAGTLPEQVIAPFSDLVIHSLSEVNLHSLIKRINEK